MMTDFGGSFWNSEMVQSMGATASALDDMLEYGSFSLEDLLEQADVIQECKSMNSLLVDYLCQPDVLRKMVLYIASPFECPVTEEDSDEKKDDEEEQEQEQKKETVDDQKELQDENNLDFQQKPRETSHLPPPPPAIDREKFAFICSELFACELVAVFDALLENSDAMEALFQPLKSKKSLHPTTAGYFRKVVGVLIQRKYEELAEYIKQNPGCLENLIYHVDSTSIMEILIMLGWDDGFYQHGNDVQWLIDLKFIPQIVNKLSAEFDEDIHINASYTLVDVVTKSPPSQESPLMDHIQSPPILNQLLKHVFSDNDSSFVHGVRVIIALLQRSVQFEADFGIPSDMLQQDIAVVASLINYLPCLVKMLEKAPSEVLPTSYGSLNPPLGEVRLRAAELTCNLVQFDSPILQSAMAELNLIPILLDLFYAYPWHNILHNLVESAIQIILAADDGKLTTFRKSLINDGRLLKRIIDAHRESTEIQSNGGFKPGNMAFVSRISLIFVDREEKDSELREIVGDDPEWNEFVENVLEAERERLMAILGEHRPTGPHHDSDEDLFDMTHDSLGAENGDGSLTYGSNHFNTFSEEGQVLDFGDDDDDNWHEYEANVDWNAFPEQLDEFDENLQIQHNPLISQNESPLQVEESL